MNAFDVLDHSLSEPFQPRYNISPSEPPLPAGSNRKTPRRMTYIPIIRMDASGPVADCVVWPLIPFWAKGEVPTYSTANARVEEIHAKKAYKGAWSKGRRCLVFATGFFEWQAIPASSTKQPWYIKLLNHNHLVFAGLWERSRRPDGEYVRSCTIVTMDANPLLRKIHNAGRNKHRMPLILDDEGQQTWLHGSVHDATTAIRRFPADEMLAYPVDRRVNNPSFDDPSVVQPMAALDTPSLLLSSRS